jgi:hypothetical protein
MKDPVTGPIPREVFAQIVAAPFGGATQAIRKFDPLWGRVAGEPIKWKVKLSRETREVGSAVVEASTEEEANEIAALLPDKDIKSIDVADYCGSWEVDEVAPA